MSHDLDFESQFRQVGAMDRWYSGSPLPFAFTNTIAAVLNTLVGLPVTFPRVGKLDRIGFAVTTVGGAGSVMRAGLYASVSSVSLAPANLIVDGGEKDTTTLGVKTTNIDVTLRPDLLYWLVYLAGVAAPTCRSAPNSIYTAVFGGDAGFGGAGLSGLGWNAAQAYGALPAAFPGGGAVVTASTPTPLIQMRFAA